MIDTQYFQVARGYHQLLEIHWHPRTDVVNEQCESTDIVRCNSILTPESTT
jgi:hypothetical protein